MTGVHLLGLRVATYGVGFLASVLIGRALGPEGRGKYTLPIVIMTIVVSLGNLGLEHAQIYLAGQRFKLSRLWANAGLVGAVVALVVWCISAIVIPMLEGSPGGVPAIWIWVALAQVPLLLQTLYWTNLLQMAGRARAAVGATLLGVGVQTLAIVGLFALGELTPFSVLLLTGVTNFITWAGTVIIWRFGRAGRVADRSQGSAFGASLRSSRSAWHPLHLLVVASRSAHGPARPRVPCSGLVLARGHARGTLVVGERSIRHGPAPSSGGCRRRR